VSAANRRKDDLTPNLVGKCDVCLAKNGVMVPCDIPGGPVYRCPRCHVETILYGSARQHLAILVNPVISEWRKFWSGHLSEQELNEHVQHLDDDIERSR
jgi:hypothetical protein